MGKRLPQDDVRFLKTCHSGSCFVMFSGPRPAYTHGLITQSVGGIGVPATSTSGERFEHTLPQRVTCQVPLLLKNWHH